MSCGLVIPTLGGPQLRRCLAAVSVLDPAPARVLVVHSGSATSRTDAGDAGSSGTTAEWLCLPRRLGFAAAVNAGVAALPAELDLVGLLNDDAIPATAWLLPLQRALATEQRLAAVQGTVSNLSGELVDGRGIVLDRWGLATQVDRDRPVREETVGERRWLLGVSGTAALLRRQALHQVVLANGDIFDRSFGSYYEDLDLALRLQRLGWQAAWIGGAACRHLGSHTGSRLHWRHPWWLLANRWRAIAGNLSLPALLRCIPRLLRGELRAQRTLLRRNRRLPLVALVVSLSLPLLLARGWSRRSPGQRLSGLDLVGAQPVGGD